MPHNINSDRMFMPNALLLGEVEKTLADGRSVELNATGNSMLPFIIGGYDTVFIRPQFQAGQLRVGHIVLAHLPDSRYVLHRIVSINDTEVLLMGDGNIHVTECCQPTDIIGVVTEIIHKGRSVDCNSRCEQRKAKIWGKLLPIRRYLLYIYKRVWL